MANSSFVYVIYIRTTTKQLWKALTTRGFMKKFGFDMQSDWKVGSPWKLTSPDGNVTDTGEIVAVDRLHRIVVKWRHELRPELAAEGYSRCVFELQPQDKAVKLTVTHTIDRANSKLIDAVSTGWPFILSNLKSLVETGKTMLDYESLRHARRKPETSNRAMHKRRTK